MTWVDSGFYKGGVGATTGAAGVATSPAPSFLPPYQASSEAGPAVEDFLKSISQVRIFPSPSQFLLPSPLRSAICSLLSTLPFPTHHCHCFCCHPLPWGQGNGERRLKNLSCPIPPGCSGSWNCLGQQGSGSRWFYFSHACFWTGREPTEGLSKKGELTHHYHCPWLSPAHLRAQLEQAGVTLEPFLPPTEHGLWGQQQQQAGGGNWRGGEGTWHRGERRWGNHYFLQGLKKKSPLLQKRGVHVTIPSLEPPLQGEYQI